MKSLSLINSEGDIISAKKRDNLYYIIDQYGATLAVFNLQALKLFLQGYITLFDSRKDEWNFLKVTASMRTPEEKITEFILS